MGCPNQCVFCNHRLISGTSSFSLRTVREQIDRAVRTLEGSGRAAEIAFFGGSVTGIERGLMRELLDIAQAYVNAGSVSGIRMSTRPDYIDADVLEILSHYTVSCVELGIQSMSDPVLRITKRGHTAEDTRLACRRLTEAGIPFAGQMMIGLPGSTPDLEMECAREICRMGAAAYRVYPTLVFRHTELEGMYRAGQYQPLHVEEAVERMGAVMEIMEEHGVYCLRAGLCESDNLHDEASFCAGPNHPAIGELARSALMRRRMVGACEAEKDILPGRAVTFFVARGKSSLAAGQHRGNIRYLCAQYGIKYVKIIEKSEQIGYNIILDV
jgi:histone acetyltransferase (RNA polymerase elongator complex component)